MAIQRQHRSLLQGAALIEIHHSFELTERTDQRCSPHGEGQTESPQTPALGEGEELDSPLFPMGAAQKSGRVTLERQINVGIVMRQHEVMAMAVGHRLIKPRLISCAGGWVVGEAQNHEA